jgi:hypothetical protein
MNIINGSKSFYRFMKRDGIVLAYFYVDDFWNHNTTEKLKNVFLENNNGNITILMVDFYKKSNQNLIDTEDITNYPIIRLYKQGTLFQEIYATYSNIDEIVNSLMN